jgi:protein lysine acetyltransferase
VSNPGPATDADTAWLTELRSSDAAERMTTFTAHTGDVLLREGEPGNTFLVLTEGTAEVRRGDTVVAVVGAGSVIGELALLTGEARTTTVTVTTSATGYRGDATDFESLLAVPEIHDRFIRVAGARLAANVVPITFRTAAGFTGVLRPLLPGDRAEYLDLLARFSPESRRRRFFSAASPSPALIDYLLRIDYLNHFAWIALDAADDEPVGAAIARFIRNPTLHDHAEGAFAVSDEHQGQGLGTLLLGAIAVAAEASGITTLTAEMLDENTAMHAVFDKAGARWSRADRGVLAATMDVAKARAVIDPVVAAEIATSVASLGRAASTLGL